MMPRPSEPSPYAEFDRRQWRALRMSTPLALTEEVTLIGQAGVSDETWQDAAKSFPDKEIVSLLMAIVAINAWNRLAVTTHQALPDLD